MGDTRSVVGFQVKHEKYILQVSSRGDTLSTTWDGTGPQRLGCPPIRGLDELAGRAGEAAVDATAARVTTWAPSTSAPPATSVTVPSLAPVVTATGRSVPSTNCHTVP
jgi:hypothetical protein